MKKLALLLLFVVALRADAATLRYPFPNATAIWDIVFTADGRAWVSTSDGIFVIGANGTAMTVAPDPHVTELVIGSDGAVWGNTTNRVIRIDPVTNVVNRFDIGHHISSFGAGPDGALWLIQSAGSNRRVIRLSTTGTVLSDNLLATSGAYSQWLVPAGDAMWTLVNGQLVRVTATSSQVFPVPIPQVFWLVSDGNTMWIASDESNPQVARIGADGTVLAQYPSTVEYIFGMTADSEGNLLMIERFTGRIVRLTPAGEPAVLTAFPEPEVPCIPGVPRPMAVAPDGRIAVGLWVELSAISPPFDPCRSDPAARSEVVIFDPASVHEVPSLNFLALAGLAILLAAAGLFLTGAR